ncbi:hypothetical protein ACHAWF_002724 [Thalassiosira exigua]
MVTVKPLIPFLVASVLAPCDSLVPAPRGARTKENIAFGVSPKAQATATEGQPTKAKFLGELDRPYDLNERTKTRTSLLDDIITQGAGLPNPGSEESFALAAPGVWKVCYAPHMTTMAGLFQGEFSVEYDLKADGTMKSHARYKFPLLNLYGYLSVSGTYGSVNDHVCRVDFDEAWVRTFDNDRFELGPYPDIISVPNSISKTVIRNVGRALFIEPFAAFPVSYLDSELIVFDFELLGTRICAQKKKQDG